MSQPDDQPAGEAPSEEEMRAAFEEQMSRVSVLDVLLQSTVTLVNLGARRLGLAGGPEERDIGEAKLAIDGARALMPLVPGEEAAPIRQALTQLQMAYAREAQASGAPDASDPGGPPGAPNAGPPPGPDPEEARRQAEEAERAKARAKIWTPGSA